jgi:plastocyanin
VQFPRILVALGLVVAGVSLPAFGPTLVAPPPGVVGMDHEGYVLSGVNPDEDGGSEAPEIVIRAGDTITFQNNSRWIHVVGPGDKGLLMPPGHGAMSPRKLMEENESYTTPAWLTPGAYLITCTVHPDMNAKVIVLP